MKYHYDENEEIPPEVCDKYHEILGIANFKTMYAHKCLNELLELERKENEADQPNSGNN